MTSCPSQVTDIEHRAAAEVASANRLIDAAVADAKHSAEIDKAQQQTQIRDAISVAQQQAFQRISSVRKEATRWVQEAAGTARTAALL